MYITTEKPMKCEQCSHTKPHTLSEDKRVGMICDLIGAINFDSNKEVLENCPLESKGCSEEEYHCTRTSEFDYE